jgi:DNA-binding response OmpR family regulator
LLHGGAARRSNPDAIVRDGSVRTDIVAAMNTLIIRDDDVPHSQPTCDVLIVEDEPAQAEELACYLIRAGLTVQVCLCGSAAIHCVTEMRPRIALLDYNLPDMDGVTVAERLKRLSPSTSMLMMSGRIDGLAESTLRKVGLYSFVNKPVEPRKLVSTMRRMARTALKTGLPATVPQKFFGLTIG